MKLNIYILLFLLVSQTSVCQNDIFKIQTVFKSELEIDKMIKKIDSLKDTQKFYEDETYVVYPECRGEWGGAITFINKRSGKEFICESTCPIIINKFKNKYIVTNTLNHLLPSTEVLEIANPEKLEVKNKNENYNFEKLAQQGAKSIIDIYHYATLGSFVYNDKLYHLVCDKEKTFIAEISKGGFLFVQDLSASRFWTYSSSILRTKNRILIAVNNFDIKGCFEIKENEITLFRTN